MSGTLGKIFRAAAPAAWGRLEWDADTSMRSTVKFRTRSASDPASLSSAAWSSWHLVSGAPITSPSASLLEVEAVLERGDTRQTPPVLRDFWFGSPAGWFSAAVTLSDGVNNVTATATRGSAASPESAPARIDYSAGFDLSVSAITAEPAAATTEEAVRLAATVTNIGSGHCPSATARYYDGDPLAGGAPLGSGYSLPDIGPGSAYVLNLDAYLPEGARTVFLVVESGNPAAEADLTNNKSSTSITVSRPPATPPDFKVESLAASSAAPDRSRRRHPLGVSPQHWWRSGGGDCRRRLPRRRSGPGRRAARSGAQLRESAPRTAGSSSR